MQARFERGDLDGRSGSAELLERRPDLPEPAPTAARRRRWRRPRHAGVLDGACRTDPETGHEAILPTTVQVVEQCGACGPGFPRLAQASGNGGWSHHGRRDSSTPATHLTHQNPRRPGATSRAGYSSPVSSCATGTPVHVCVACQPDVQSSVARTVVVPTRRGRRATGSASRRHRRRSAASRAPARPAPRRPASW